MEELEVLRTHPLQWNNIVLPDGEKMTLEGVKGNTCELEINVPANPTAKRFGVKVRTSPNEEETTLVYYDTEKKKLCFDSRKSSTSDTDKYVRIEVGGRFIETGEEEPQEQEEQPRGIPARRTTRWDPGRRVWSQLG